MSAVKSVQSSRIVRMDMGFDCWKDKGMILQGDTLEMLKTLDSESVDCVITSPPYWGLRDYGTV